MPKQKQSATRVQAQLRRERAVQLRLAGCTYAQIADQLDVSTAHSFKLIKTALDQSVEKTAETAAQLRELELQRLDIMQKVLWPNVLGGDGDSVDRCLKIQARRAKLAGLDLKPAADQFFDQDVTINVTGIPVQHDVEGNTI